MSTTGKYDPDSLENQYWEKRKYDLYYVAIVRYLQVIAEDAESLLDVGSNKTQFLEWLDWIPDRAALDIMPFETLPPVRAIVADFLRWSPDRHYDVAICCQVMEHIETPRPFGEKLLQVADRVLVSVPYKWIGNTPGHVQDPVDEEKFRSWFPVRPNYLQIVHDPLGPPRMFGYFDLANGPTFRFEQEQLRQARARRSVKLP